MNNTTGYGNYFLGRGAGISNTTGHSNMFFGLLTGGNNETGNRNIFIGANTGLNNGPNSHENIFIGMEAGRENQGSNNIFLGSNSGRLNTDGLYNVFIGNQSGYSNTTANANTSIGHQAGRNFTTGINNTNLGYRAGYGDPTNNATGNSNTNIGGDTGYFLTTGRDNSFVGYRAGYRNTTGYRNAFFGFLAGSGNTTGVNNTLLGANTATGLTTGSNNTYIGYASGPNIASTGGSNTTLGGGTAGSLTTGSNNTFLGHNAGNATTEGAFNVAIGKEASRFNTTGTGNISLGYRAGGVTTGNRNIVIGYRSHVASTANNQLNIGNLIYGTGVNTGTENTVSTGSIGLGTANPKTNAILDMSNVNNQGVLMPKVALTGTTDMNTVDITTIGTEDSKNLLVYNTATIADVTEGYYYWNGSTTDGKWEKLISESELTNSAVFTANSTGSLISNSFTNSERTFNYRAASFVVGSDSMDNIPNADDDRRMFFNRDKAAFRVGQAGNTEWDDVNIGLSSIAMGNNTIASSFGSFAVGIGTRSTNFASIAMGLGSIASGANSFAAGSLANASNTNSVAIGPATQAVGANSFALGSSATSESFGQFSIGLYPTVTTGDISNYVATDRLFVVGNGEHAGLRSDALTLFKDGNMTIAGGLTTATKLYPDYVFENYVNGNSKMNKTYTFKSIEEVESFIKANKHLPGVTGIKNLKKTKDGYQVNLTELSTQTLEKVEELYLHTIEQHKKINKLEDENKLLKERLQKIEALLGIKN